MAQRQLYSGLDLYDWRGTGPNGRTKAVDVDKWQQNQEDIRHLPGAFPVQSVVITDGQITPTAAALSVDTEGGAPADDLTAIAPGDLHAGMLLALCSVDAGRKVTIKNSAGASGIQTLDGKDVVLDTQYAVMLRLVSTESLTLWREEPGPLRLGLTVSSPDTLGGVKVQTGDDDGLEMTGGELRVRKANTTQRGSVLASETAQAGAVPLGGADGSLGPDWLKKAMEAAEAAQKEAEEKTTPAQVAEYGAPDFARSIDITISTTSYTQCIPEDGFLQIVWSGSNAQAYNYILKSTTGSEQPDTKHLCAFTGEGFVHSGLFPVAKGIYLKRQSANTGNFEAQFIPAKGANGNA